MVSPLFLGAMPPEGMGSMAPKKQKNFPFFLSIKGAAPVPPIPKFFSIGKTCLAFSFTHRTKHTMILQQKAAAKKLLKKP